MPQERNKIVKSLEMILNPVQENDPKAYIYKFMCIFSSPFLHYFNKASCLQQK